MNIKIQGHHLHASDALKRLIERQSRKIARLLPTYPGPDLELHVTLEKLPRGQQYHAVLVLTTPQRVIRAEEMQSNASTGVLRSFEELTRRVKRFKSQLNREKYWKRKYVRSQEDVPAESLEDLETSINQNLDRVENYIRREVYHHSIIESLPPGLLDAQAILDEVFLTVSTQAHAAPVNIGAEQWMFQVAREALSRRLEALRQAKEELHLEDPVPQPSKWEDEELNFHHPDEVLHLEDLIQDEHSISPEEALEREERIESLQRAIAKLPVSVRDSFVLFDLEGFHSDEVAMMTGKEQSEVIKDVETARAQLREEIRGLSEV